MSSSLIPERPLLISPTLAATIGLEESVMLHVLSELKLNSVDSTDGLTWLELDHDMLSTAMPFWTLDEIKGIQQSLLEKGLIQLDTVGNKSGSFKIAINQVNKQNPQQSTSHASSHSSSQSTVSEKTQEKSKPASAPNPLYTSPTTGKATIIPEDWQPSEDLYQICTRRNIPRNFIEEHVRLFVISQQERKRAQYSWHNIFYKYILKEWESSRSHMGLKELEANMSADWLPSGDAFNILEHASISHSFIEDAVPEFVLYWRETGLKTSTWNTKFIAHVRRQWAKFEAALEHDATPKLLPEDYQPSEEVFEVLEMANIDSHFAHELIPEFILYWRERKEVCTSWHTKFLQHVKFKWSHRQEDKGDFIERVTDRSWAN